MAATGTGNLINNSTAGICYPPLTVAAWIYLPATNPSGQTTSAVYSLLDKSDFSNQINLHFAGTFGTYVFGSVCATFAGHTIDCTMSGDVPGSPGFGWYHVAATTVDSGGIVSAVKIYLNGTLNNTVSSGGPIGSWSATDHTEMVIQFGNVNGTATCVMAYPAAWNAGLTDDQIATLATSGTDPSTVATSSLISFAPLQSADMTIDKVAGSWAITSPVSYVADPFSLAPPPPIPTLSTFGNLLQNYHPYHARVKFNSRYYEVGKLLSVLNQTNDSRLGLLVDLAPDNQNAKVINSDGSLNQQISFDIPRT